MHIHLDCCLSCIHHQYFLCACSVPRTAPQPPGSRGTFAGRGPGWGSTVCGRVGVLPILFSPPGENTAACAHRARRSWAAWAPGTQADPLLRGLCFHPDTYSASAFSLPISLPHHSWGRPAWAGVGSCSVRCVRKADSSPSIGHCMVLRMNDPHMSMWVKSHFQRSRHGTAETNPTRNREVAGLISGLAQGVEIWCCRELWCRSQTQLGSGIAMALA